MHDIRYIRNSPELFDKHLARRRIYDITSADVLALDACHRDLIRKTQEAQQLKNEIAQKIGKIKAGVCDDSELSLLASKASDVRKQIDVFDKSCSEVQAELNAMLSSVPNILDDSVPDGVDETENRVEKHWGEIKQFNFPPKAHYEIGERLGLMDFDAAARIAGSRFVVLKGELARLERALAAYMLDNHVSIFGYTEVSPPFIVNSDAVFGVGQLPKFAEDMFKITDGRWLIPTAEVSLTNLVRDSIINADKLPLRYTAYTPCFRSEAGSAGKDTRGMIRAHQFSKVEMVSVVRPEDSVNEHERMTSIAEGLLQELDLPYRVVCLCSGDTGFSSQKTYDIEVWLPNFKRYREISSCSNCGSFQARRMSARFKYFEDGKKKIEYVHTLNGSGLPIGRTMIAILENYQQSDCTVVIPEVLRKYMNNAKEINLHGGK
ncbi:MAG: serine--tRNA ligase [Holosporales bacterium]|jgi:seryl-tRNA synthetase|nr:serine--tRNA ligase [Holosporales bacterium]